VGNYERPKMSTKATVIGKSWQITVFPTVEHMPEPGRTVIVRGGLAYWTGIQWISRTGDANELPLEWQPRWWTPILSDRDVNMDNSDPR
jgi:hypothetical protein